MYIVHNIENDKVYGPFDTEAEAGQVAYLLDELGTGDWYTHEVEEFPFQPK